MQSIIISSWNTSFSQICHGGYFDIYCRKDKDIRDHNEFIIVCNEVIFVHMFLAIWVYLFWAINDMGIDMHVGHWVLRIYFYILIAFTNTYRLR